MYHSTKKGQSHFQRLEPIPLVITGGRVIPREGEAPAEPATPRFGRSLTLPTNNLVGYAKKRCLWRQAMNRPFSRFLRIFISKSIVQSRRFPLPKLDHVGYDFVATPVVRARYRPICEFNFELLNGAFQLHFIKEQLRLRRCDCPKLARPRTGSKVLIRYGSSGFHGFAFDANLTIKHGPKEMEGDLRIKGNLHPFIGVVVREKRETIRIDRLQQYDSAARTPVWVCSGQGHGVNLEPFRFFCGL